MAIIIFQCAAVFAFAVGSFVLGLWLRHSKTRETAERASRFSHLMYWGLLVFPGMIGFFRPGLTHYDELLGIPSLPFRLVDSIVGAVLLLVGLFLLIITNRLLAKVGKGAAAFMLTKSVVVDRVYNFTRNPMSLGYYSACVGAGLLAGSTSITVGVILGVIPAHVFNLKYFEETELDLRHGQSYREYRQRVPFLIPNLVRSRAVS